MSNKINETQYPLYLSSKNDVDLDVIDFTLPWLFQDCENPATQEIHIQSSSYNNDPGVSKIHSDKKPYVCQWTGCQWKFRRLDALTRHARVHTGEKPYKCIFCQSSFARSDHLVVHQKKQHSFLKFYKNHSTSSNQKQNSS